MPRTAIFLTLRASEQLRRTLLLGYGVLGVLLWFSVPLWPSVLLLGLLVLSWFRLEKLIALRTGGTRIVGLSYRNHQGDSGRGSAAWGLWSIYFDNGRQVDCFLVRSDQFFAYWLLLDLIDGHGVRYRIPVWPDSADADGFRHLRILLKLQS